MSDFSVTAMATATAKLTGLGVGAVVAVVVVMAMTRPRSSPEWAVALVCTVMASLCGGSYLALHSGLAAAAAGDLYSMMAIIGLAFVAGLPAWVTVRLGFAWFARDGVDILEIIRELRKLRNGGRDE